MNNDAIAQADYMTSETRRLALDALDAALDCLSRDEWADARRHMWDAIEDAAIAEKWETVERFVRR